MNKGDKSPSQDDEVAKSNSKDSSAKVTTSTPAKTSLKIAREITVSTNQSLRGTITTNNEEL